ncbi:MAG: sulfur oxidation c-type cytochrome SoxX [Polynucleobacter sp. 24-46-87]|jgi:sulfur-oxidizing protein SoxX|nr:MAG: sulfur oxidation c-type cytochrome SoxX [Polynucleobacter sp. 35-46-207]OYZ35966.1 MAG: sulfur oxidation c-type cytochrome SoxX [Polynucleobacter sp. 16-46-70]OZA13605.1 MAG: sulfur oxidation c-type cytochrome SoxX [Polynucleobacter sp. 24-46-87]OZA40980.1 MAG: sulfur oxidation c-type cytochrome SoxX [Polynucleobacter sp. 17-46-58]OZB48702.1 MAG: sulfur oxidation c-type cytochrome SoxX [Polynucleobacter sp. 39-45-136]
MKNKLSLLALALTLSIGAAHAATPFEKMMSSSFEAKGQAGLDRLDQDAAQKFCSNPANLTGGGDVKTREKIQNENMATIKQPSDGKYIGDWKSGEKIAQSGRGATWSDKAGSVNGGSCYNCHQINIKEVSYGNIGPSLWNYGKLRGYSKEVVEYTWNRINNAKAYNVCSNMPRFGHFKLLTEKQMQDVMALLLDPESPVNK